MTNRSHGWRVPALLLFAAAVAMSCAGTKDVDVTPQLRTRVDAHVGKSMTSDGKNVENISKEFTTNETIYAVVDVPGKTEGTIKVKWMFGEQTLDERSMPIQDDANVYPFQLPPREGGNPPGEYRFEVYINDDRADMEVFQVKAS